MHDEVYERLAKKGKVSWDGIDSPEKLFDHDINISLAKRIDHYFPEKAGRRVVDLGCGTGTAALYLASLGFSIKGFDVSPNAIDMANKNKEALGLEAEFEACDLIELNHFEADLTIDSSLLHCLVDKEDRKKFFSLCSGLTFIHTMIESKDMSEITDRDYMTFQDGVLWSEGPKHWDMDWHDINGLKMFKHRRISSENGLLKEIEDNGFEMLEYFVKSQNKSASTLVGWMKRKDNK